MRLIAIKSKKSAFSREGGLIDGDKENGAYCHLPVIMKIFAKAIPTLVEKIVFCFSEMQKYPCHV